MKTKNLYIIICSIILIVTAFHLQIFASESIKVNKVDIVGKEYEIGTVINSNNKMKWIAIDYDRENPSKVFIVTKNIIDYREYHDNRTNYKNSKIRYYLNTEFYNKSFSEEEKKHIVLSEISVNIKSGKGSDVENETMKTEDRIFLLSVDEALKYISINKDIKENTYANSIYPYERTNDDADFAFWTRDIINYNKPIVLISPQTEKGVDVFAYQGIVVGMWYDFSEKVTGNKLIDEERQINEKFLIERKSGKEKSISYIKEDSDSVRFDTSISNRFREVTFGTYHKNKNNRDLTWILSWYVVDDDGREVTLLSKDIIEYIEIEYDTYDIDKLSDDPYSHSNLKQYINEDLYNNIFDDNEKQLIISNNDERMTIPNINDIFNYDLLSERITYDDLIYDRKNVTGNLILNRDIERYYYTINNKMYFVNISYEYNGMPYVLSLMQEAGKDRVFFNFSTDINDTANIVTCSGIRPIVKVDRNKFKSYLKKYKNIDLENVSEKAVSSKEGKIRYGEKVKFGKYEQDNDLSNGKEDIIWKVIKKSGDKYLLLADSILDVIDLSNDIINGSYEDTFVYYFANSIFYEQAFAQKEREKLNVINSLYTVYDGANLTENNYEKSIMDKKGCYNKVANMTYSLDKNDYMYEGIYEAVATKYVLSKYKNIDSYLLEDTVYVNDMTRCLQVKLDGTIENKKSSIAGFRPMISIKKEDLIILLNNK